MKVQFLVDRVQQVLTCLVPVQFRKVEAVSRMDGAAEIFVPGDFIGEFLLRVNLFCPYPEGLAAIGERVAAYAAVPSSNVHNGFVWIKVPQDVGVDACAVVCPAQDGLSTYHHPPPFHLLRETCCRAPCTIP